MLNSIPRNNLLVLVLGDAAVLLAVTLIGFASHSRSILGGRWLITYLPLLTAWFFCAVIMGLFQQNHVHNLREIWRPVAAGVLAAPLAVLLRALWLGQTVIPVFGLVMIGTTAAGMGIWRLSWAAWSARKYRSNGRNAAD